MTGELQEDGQVKATTTTYSHLRLPRYKHSVPVQEMLKELRWEAFREGRWGNRPNPLAPTGDVRPKTAVNTTCG